MYPVKILGDHLERKDTTSKIPKSMCCNYKADFTLMAIKCVKKPTNALWHGNSMSHNRMLEKTLLLKEQIQLESILWAQAGEFQSLMTKS
jgi:hypothetical protein